VGLRCFVLDGAVLSAVCDEPFIPSLVVLLGGPLRLGQRCYDRGDVLSDLVLRCVIPYLAQVEADLSRGTWLDDNLGRQPFGDYAEAWLRDNPGWDPATARPAHPTCAST
jgi:hypothetical protein